MFSETTQRQEWIYFILAGIFLGTVGMVNILGLSRLIDIPFSFFNYSFSLTLPIGVLPYPITFLCTDLISEFFGKARAKMLVWIGLGINVWLLFIIWSGGLFPSSHPDHAFFIIRTLTMSSIVGSMVAYVIAQLLDIHIFTFCKKLTKGKHLWLRNNASTLISQSVDTVIVVSIACYLAGDALPTGSDSIHLILSSYCFKVLAAILSTIPFYGLVIFLKRFLRPLSFV